MGLEQAGQRGILEFVKEGYKALSFAQGQIYKKKFFFFFLVLFFFLLVCEQPCSLFYRETELSGWRTFEVDDGGTETIFHIFFPGICEVPYASP